MVHKGTCLCGKVSFEVEGDFENFYLCHCERCRKDSGSAHAANLFSSTADLRWLSGEEYVRVFDLEGHIKSFALIAVQLFRIFRWMELYSSFQREVLIVTFRLGPMDTYFTQTGPIGMQD